MTPQEKQLLESLASRIANTQVPQKDPDAEALIKQTIGSKPDSLYVLTQTVLIQEMALNQANQRLHDLQQQIDHQEQQRESAPSHFLPDPPPQKQSFLGRLFGSTASRPSAPPPPPPSAGGYYQDAPPVYYQSAPPSAAGSFLRSAAATATGVAAGALAFEGIEELIGGRHGYGGFGGPGFGGEFLGGAPQETIINNYYDEPRGEGREQEERTDYRRDDDQDADIQNADYDDLSDNGSDVDLSDDSSDDSSVDV